MEQRRFEEQDVVLICTLALRQIGVQMECVYQRIPRCLWKRIRFRFSPDFLIALQNGTWNIWTIWSFCGGCSCSSISSVCEKLFCSSVSRGIPNTGL